MTDTEQRSTETNVASGAFFRYAGMLMFGILVGMLIMNQPRRFLNVSNSHANDSYSQLFPADTASGAFYRAYVFVTPEDCVSRWSDISLFERDTFNIRLEQVVIVGEKEQLATATKDLRDYGILQPTSIASPAMRQFLKRMTGQDQENPMVVIRDMNGLVRVISPLPGSSRTNVAFMDLLKQLSKTSYAEKIQ